MSYAYNGQGDRLRETAAGGATEFTLDLESGLTQVLSAGGHTYTYGLGRIAQHDASGAGYFLGDALGSVRQVVDGAGDVTLAQSYRPYGERFDGMGTGTSSYGFTGEWTSSSTNLLYLRARFYEPLTGRFLSKDLWEGDYLKSLSYNKYQYAYDNPVLYTDPTGQTPAVVAALLPALVGGAAGFVVGAAAGGVYGACVYELALAGQCGCEMQRQALSMTKQDWIGAHALGAGVIGGVGGAIATYGPVGMIAVGVGGIVISGADIYNTYNLISNETGLTTCTVTRLIMDVTTMVFSGVGIVKGVRAWRASGSPLKWIGAPEPLSGKSALDSMYSQSRPGRGPSVKEIPGANPVDWFHRIADPSSIKPHPNPKVASQGGLAGTILGGGQIFYRPITSSGNPAIDTFNVPGYFVDWKYHFPPK